MTTFQKSICIGSAAGVINGFLGAGAGLLLVPLYARWLHMPPRKALATSVATVAPLCLLSAMLYMTRGAIPMNIAWPYLVGGLGGGFLGSLLFARVPLRFLSFVLASVMLYGGLRMLGVV